MKIPRFSSLQNSTVGLVSFSLYLLLMCGVLYISYLPGRDALHYWEQETLINFEINNHLASLSREFGYGGFIHHFKNFVLRRDQQYLDWAQESLDKSFVAVHQLTTIPESRVSGASVRPVLETILEYQAKTEWILANREYVDSLPTKELDSLVRVDDSQAFAALTRVHKINQEQLDESLKESDEQHRSLVAQVLVSAIFISLIYWVATFFLVSLLRSSRRHLRQLSTINQYAPLALIVLDQNGRCVAANQKFLTLFNMPVDQPLNTIQVEQLMPSSYREHHQKLRTDFVAQQRAYAMGDRNRTIEGITFDGKPLQLEISIVSLQDDMPGHAMAIIKDAAIEEELRLKSTTDHLTQIRNRRFAEEAAQVEIERVNRYGINSALVLFDIDNFKTINDQYGHAVGDDILQGVVRTIQNNLRNSDMFARWGGDEFMLLLPNTSLEQARETAEKLLVLVRELTFNGGLNITLSIGVTEIKPDRDYEELFKLADCALYSAKEDGRNRVETA